MKFITRLLYGRSEVHAVFPCYVCKSKMVTNIYDPCENERTLMEMEREALCADCAVHKQPNEVPRGRQYRPGPGNRAMLSQDYIKTLDCGYRRGTYEEIIKYYPSLEGVLYEFPQDHADYYFDVKVHMLMPGQYPCIPNWHRDFVPRVDGQPDLTQIDTSMPFYLWLSNGPYTEFIDNRPVTHSTWIPFTMEDLHRGSVSKKHTWRLFIRAVPRIYYDKHRAPSSMSGPVRHAQVYLDAGRFNW